MFLNPITRFLEFSRAKTVFANINDFGNVELSLAGPYYTVPAPCPVRSVAILDSDVIMAGPA